MAEEIRIPKSIRLTAAEWAQVDEAASAFGLEPAVLLRRLVVKSLRDLSDEVQRRKREPETLPF